MTSRGSEWNKWDLHVHTPESVLRSEYGDNWDKYIIDLFNAAIENNIKCIGITDYFFIDGYKKIKTEYLANPARMIELLGEENYKLAKEILILPNIEFRIDKLVISREKDLKWNRKVNYHLLLCDSISPDVIEKEIINSLKFDYYSEPGAQTDRRNFTKENIIELGNNLSKFQEDFADNSPLFVGMINSCFNLDELKHILNTNGKFKGKYILGLPADEDLSEISWTSQGHATRKNLIMQSHIIFSSNKGTISFCKGEKHSSKDDFIKEFGNLKPCVWGSDAHSADKLFKPDGNRHTWIKGALSFDGLKQIIYEPISRVKIQESHPQIKASYQTIKRARFICNDDKFPSEWIYFSKDLNTVIGGKSSGKSLLLYFVASAINQDEVIEKTKLVESERYDSTNFNFEVEWDDGSKSLLSETEDCKPITYIPQLYINKLAEEDGRKQLKKLIEDILIQNEKYKKFSEDKSSEISKTNKGIKENIEKHQAYFENYKVINEDKNKIGNKESIENEIKRLENESKILREKSGFSESEIDKFNLLSLRIKNAEHRLQVLNQYKSNSEKFVKEITVRLDGYLVALKAELGATLNISDAGTFTKKYYKIITDGTSRICNDIDKIHTIDMNRIPSLLQKITNKKTIAEEEIKPLLQKIKEKETLDLNSKNILIEREKLNKVNNYQKLIDKLVEDAKNNLLQLKNEYKSLLDCYKSFVLELSSDEYNISGDMQIIPKIGFDLDGFNKFINSYDLRGNIKSLLGDSFDERNIFSFNEKNHINEINKIYENTKKENIPQLKKGVTKKDIIYALYDDYFFIDYEIKYNNDEILKMSPGKRGLVLLNLLLHLSNSTHPILIDQPEDNLDNRTIYEQLNNFIKERKLTRQIILVTHNANLVVAADAECVIIANQSGQIKNGENEKYQFEYLYNCLENSFQKIEGISLLKSMGIRQHVCDILEGGQDAFKEREIKYGLKH